MPSAVDINPNDARRVTGIVKRMLADKGFGFLIGPNGDVFMHRSACAPLVFEHLRVGDTVSFLEAETNKGRRAEAVLRA